MGQGVNMKIRTIVARTLGIDVNKIILQSTNTSRVANTSPTAASSGADLNGKAAALAAIDLYKRLLHVAASELNHPVKEISIKDNYVYAGTQKSKLDFKKLIWLAYTKRTNLTQQAYYATPDLFYDKQKEKGQPFAYHVFGTAITEVSVDCLRGTYDIARVDVVHDAGASLNPVIDRGQLEGGLMQGLGWMTLEELVFNNKGRLITDALTTYKVPDVYFMPKELNAVFLTNADNPKAVLKSKAIGEPPLMYGIGVYFAIMQALQSFRSDKELIFSAPMTPEKVLSFLYF